MQRFLVYGLNLSKSHSNKKLKNSTELLVLKNIWMGQISVTV